MSTAATSRSGVDDLGPEALLAAVRDNERVRREADLRQLHLAYQWCVLHPATADTGVAVWGGDGDLDADESLGGDGTPMVAAFAPEPFGLALGVSTDTAKTLLADALDLVHRLPHTWRRLQTLRGAGVAGPPARPEDPRPERQGRRPRRPAPRPPPAHRRRHPPRPGHRPRHREVHARGARAARGARPGRPGTSTLHHPNPTEFAGTSELHVTGDTMTLTNLYDQICAGRRRPQDRRRRRPARGPQGQSTRPPHRLRRRPSSTCTSTWRTSWSRQARPPSTGSAGSRSLGPATTDKIRAWLGDTKATIQPVLRMDRTDAVDTHDPPPGCGTWSSSATPPASSPTANATHGTATSTTSCRTTTPDHPAKPVQPTSHPCVG